MTDNTFFEPEPASTEPPKSRRTMIIGGAVAGALVLAAGGYFLLGGGEKAAGTTASANSLGLPAKAAVPVAKKKAVAKIPAASTEHLGRDPFLALYVVPVASTTGTGGTASTGGTTTPTPTSTATPAPAKTTKHLVKLVSVNGVGGSTAVAKFTVDGKASFVKQGAVFGPTKEIHVKLIARNYGEPTHVAIVVGEDGWDMYPGDTHLVL